MTSDPAITRSLSERAARVFDCLDGLIENLDTADSHRALLRLHIDEGRAQFAAYPGRASAQVPLLVHAAITGDEAPALPLAAACVLIYLGADLFDNIADDEMPERWRGWPLSQASLAAATLLSALPPLALARLEIRPARLWPLVRLFADGLLSMSAGQHDDLRFQRRADVTLAEVRTFVERQSGRQVALFARAAAMLATDDPRIADAYAGFGLAFGAAGQIASDIGDIYGKPVSPDLLNGRRTLPVSFAIGATPADERADLLALLEEARQSPECHPQVRDALTRAGALRYSALIVEAYRQQARRHLAAAAPRSPAGETLLRMLDETSLIGADGPDRRHG